MKGFFGSSARLAAAALISTAVATAVAPSANASPYYLALGDSVTFGFDPSTPSSEVPSYANQGFVKPFADYLGQVTGTRPTVDNLAISGELSTSFFSGTSPAGWTYREPGWNLNYADTSVSQNAEMQSTIASIHASGGTVGYVSLLFGANDLQYLAANPAFQTASLATQQAMVGAVISTIQSNYVTVLSELKTLAPEVKILLPGYYNPYAPLGSSYALFGEAIKALDNVIAADATHFGAKYVDLLTPFIGNELALTNIGSGDPHPNQAGYAVIAQQLEAAAVPEPSSVLVFSAGIVGLAFVGYRKRRAA